MRIARSKSQTFCAAAIATLLLCAPTVFGALQENCNTIEAAFTLADGDKTYFLSGGEYIEYSLYRESEAKVGPITALGLTRRANHPDAAFTLTNDILVILKECKYFKYSRQDNGRLALREEGNNFGGLPCSPDAAISLADETLVFKDCSVWKFSNTTQSFQPDGGLAERGLPCHLDAAVRWKSQQTIFIKSTSFWKSAHEITGPYHTDDLNLCSWYLCGEADWMTQRNRGRLECNGDKRFCQLRLNQVTLPGLHNAGAGFDGGLFYGVDCWVRNHARSILQQLQLGIRYLDIDSSYHSCSVLGSNHNSLCGGSICRMLKQTRKFLSENPHEVIALTFNHEMQDVDLVIPALTRQLKSQLGPMLNNKFRLWREQRWPKLRQAVRTNKRVFVFYTPAVQNEPYGNRFYRRKKWIHSESWVGSTWREFTVNDGNCSEVSSKASVAR
ncbi:hypothetical protein RRG08_006221 [Elysia crispata]|uniref:Uncharacterized protein n=1 Tax=Elysia crispata TaxID=231223 RepID=A0AAE0Y8A9_9GAST|nr:hypothetical protein RRG08_006221 [Elysia crispata]